MYVIEDAAEAHGGKYKGREIGTLGDMAAYSLYVAHIISTVEGGIVTTNREDFADVLRSLRSHGRFCKCEQCVFNSGAVTCDKRFVDGTDKRFFFERIGFSAKMNEMEAAIGLGNIELYDSILSKRRENLLYIMNQFNEFEKHLFTFKQEDYEEIGPHAFPFAISPGAGFTKDDLANHLKKYNVDFRYMFLSMPTQCPGFEFLGHKLGEFPEAEYIANNGIHIGVHQDLTKEHLDYFLSVIRDYLKGK